MLEVCKLISSLQVCPVAPPEVMSRHFICGPEITGPARLGIDIVPYAVRAVTITVHAVLERFVSRPERFPRIRPEMVIRTFVKHRRLRWRRIPEPFGNVHFG